MDVSFSVRFSSNAGFMSIYAAQSGPWYKRVFTVKSLNTPADKGWWIALSLKHLFVTLDVSIPNKGLEEESVNE